MLQRLARNHFTHHQGKNRRREQNTRPESKRHAAKLGVRFLRRRMARLKGHSADRAGARSRADDLRVHRTGIFDLITRGGWSGRVLLARKILPWVRLELGQAGCIAKMVSLSLIIDM